MTVGRAMIPAGPHLPIAPGTRIGPYEVVGWLGAGGMGEVYRARDPRLARDVAIKLIPESLATDRTRLHRFEQEARAVGQLNHPNILAVYDIGTHAGAPFIVSELLEGQTLRQLLTPATALPFRKAVDYARQIADGLAAAHDKGIVHRDLKPENLFVTNGGRVKILDFGIAKLTRASDAIVPETGFPTETAEGMIVGTIGYMSPEQVRGEPLDPRSDLFNFGTILYEMLTGRVAFTRATAAETVAAILKEDPPAPLPSTVSPALARIVSRCLEKSREARFQSARDLAFGLEFLSGEDRASAAGGAVRGYPRSWLGHHTVPWILAGALGLALVIAVALNFIRSPPVPELVNTLVERFPPGGEKQLDGSGGAHMITISRDGEHVAYVATPFGLYHQLLSNLEARAIPGTEAYSGAREPVFSPDGKSIAFFVVDDQTIKRMPVAGGPAQTLCKARTPFGMSWGPGGITYGQGANGVWRVSENGGEAPVRLVPVKPGEQAHGPQVLPGGKYVLFTLAAGGARDRWDNARIVVQSISDASDQRMLFTGGSDARYVEKTGHIVYAFRTKLFARTFDLQTLVASDQGVQIIDGVGRASGNATGSAHFSFSSTGRLIYVPAPVSASTEQLDLAIMTREGQVTALQLPVGAYAVPRVSPDSTRVVFADEGKPGIIWVADLSGKSPKVTVADKGNNRFPIWRDRNRIVFQSDLQGDGLYSQAADGSGTATLLVKALPGEPYAPEAWHPTEDLLLLSVTKGSDISLATWSPGDGSPAPFGNLHSSAPFGATFSHDGKWVAYSVEEEGVTRMYVQSFPVGDPHRLPSTAAESPKHPIWSPGDRQVIYNPTQKDFEAVSITTAPRFDFGRKVKVPKFISGGSPGTRTPYDIVPTTGAMVGLITWGKREFIRPSYNEIRLLQNWFDDLRAKVPRR